MVDPIQACQDAVALSFISDPRKRRAVFQATSDMCSIAARSLRAATLEAPDRVRINVGSIFAKELRPSLSNVLQIFCELLRGCH